MEYLYPELSLLDDCGCSQHPMWLLVLLSVSHLFLVINSSANFIIYFSIGDIFKRVLDRSNSVMVTIVRLGRHGSEKRVENELTMTMQL